MPVTIDGNTGVSAVQSGVIAQSNLAAGVAGNGPLLISGSASSISVSANTNTAFSSFGTSVTDTASCFNISNGRFTPTVAGYYQVTGSVYYSNSGVNTVYVSTMIYKNGVESFGTAQVSPSGYPIVQATGLVYLNGSTDYIQVYAYIVGASATNVVARIHAFLARSA